MADKKKARSGSKRALKSYESQPLELEPSAQLHLKYLAAGVYVVHQYLTIYGTRRILFTDLPEIHIRRSEQATGLARGCAKLTCQT